jgi:hypothetical protein
MNRAYYVPLFIDVAIREQAARVRATRTEAIPLTFIKGNADLFIIYVYQAYAILETFNFRLGFR